MSVFHYIADNWDQIGPQIVTHLEIVAECIVITSLIGLGLGIAAARSEPLSTLILAVTSTILTVPSFALFGLLSIWFGLANPPGDHRPRALRAAARHPQHAGRDHGGRPGGASRRREGWA